MTKAAWEHDYIAAKFESLLPAGLAQAAPDLQVGRLPNLDSTMPAAFGTPFLTGEYEDNPVGPVVPYIEHDGPQLGGHGMGHGSNIDLEESA